MSLIGLLIVLSLFCFILYLINSMIPMQPQVKMILNVVAVIGLLLWLFNRFGGGLGI